MLVVSLVTLGSPEQLTGGYLYHRRMADAAAAHDASIKFVSVRLSRSPIPARRGDVDVVLVDSIAAARVAPWARVRPPSCLAAILHQPPGGIDLGRARRAVRARLDRSLYRRCSLLMAASTALAAELETDHGLPAERIRVVPPGCDPSPKTGEARELRAGRRAAFLSIGNWMARKDTLSLLEAFARLEPDLATLHMVGRDDVEPRYGRRVRARLSAPDLAGRVIVHGPVPSSEVSRLYAGADAFVLTSRREPYGTVYGEAMAAGLPVVGWRAGNLAHLARDGCEGAVLDPGDVDGLCRALRRLAVDELWRLRLGQGARRRAAGLLTWQDTAAAFFGALRPLASGRDRT
jgi:glycosyltransferase involved in cell wall biosynthesis